MRPSTVDAGVPDLRLELLSARYEELLAIGLPLAPNEAAALEAFRQPFAELCAELDSRGIGSTVQHDDLHMNNVYVKGDSIRVLDWGDASIGHPFFSLFETFRFLVELNRLDLGDAWFGRLRDAYLEPWGPGHVETFDLALRIAGSARAIAWIDQRNALTQRDRPAFDAAFVGLLRIALEAGAGSMWC